MITERAGTVLNILVNEYINTATPVASDDIARLSPIRVSPATVRNAMSRLTEEGYISRPTFRRGVSLPTWGTAIMWNLWKGPRSCRHPCAGKFTSVLAKSEWMWRPGPSDVRRSSPT